MKFKESHPAAALPESGGPVARLRRRGGGRVDGRLVRAVPSGDPRLGREHSQVGPRRATARGHTLDGSLVVIPNISLSKIPKESGGTPSDRPGAVLIEGLTDRDKIIAAILERLDPDPCPATVDPRDADPELVADLLAVGFCYLQVELTTRQLRYMSSLDSERLRSGAGPARRKRSCTGTRRPPASPSSGRSTR